MKFDDLVESIMESTNKADLHSELMQVKSKLKMLKNPTHDADWSIRPSAVIKKRQDLMDREKEILKQLKEDK
jgi:hypothetical protein